MASIQAPSKSQRAKPVEVWVQPNRRVPFILAILPTIILLILIPIGSYSGRSMWGMLCSGQAVIALYCLTLAYQGVKRCPVGYADGKLILEIGPKRQRIEVPIEFVEAFLLSQGPAMLPGDANRRVEARTLSIKLADRGTDWAQRDTDPSLAKWCGGYITIFGAWCEPLSITLVNRLNQRLYDVTHQEVH